MACVWMRVDLPRARWVSPGVVGYSVASPGGAWCWGYVQTWARVHTRSSTHGRVSGSRIHMPIGCPHGHRATRTAHPADSPNDPRWPQIGAALPRDGIRIQMWRALRKRGNTYLVVPVAGSRGQAHGHWSRCIMMPPTLLPLRPFLPRRVFPAFGSLVSSDAV